MLELKEQETKDFYIGESELLLRLQAPEDSGCAGLQGPRRPQHHAHARQGGAIVNLLGCCAQHIVVDLAQGLLDAQQASRVAYGWRKWAEG